MKKFLLLLNIFVAQFLFAQTNPELMVATGHIEGGIHHAEYTSDERLLLTSAYDGMIVWDVANGLELKKFKRAVRIEIPFAIPGSPDFGSVHDGVVRLFDGYSLQERVLAQTSLYFICKSITVDQQGKFMYMAGQQYDANNYRAILYKVNLQSGQVQLVSQIRAAEMGVPNPDHTSGITYQTLSVTPDGSKVMVNFSCYKCTGESAFWQVFNTTTLAEEKKIKASYAGFAANNIMFTAVAVEIAKGEYRYPLTFQKYPSQENIKTFNEKLGGFYYNFQNRNLKLDATGKRLVVGNRYALSEFNLTNMTVQKWIADTTGGYNVQDPVLSPVTESILRPTANGSIEQFNARTKTVTPFGDARPFSSEMVTAHHTQKIISRRTVSVGIQIIDLNREVPKVYFHPDKDNALDIAWAPVGNKGVYFSGVYSNSTIGLLDAAHPEKPAQKYAAPEVYGAVSAIQWSNNGKWFVIGVGYAVYVWDADKMQQIKKLPGNERYIGGNVGINDDGTLVAINFLRPNASDASKASFYLAVYAVADGRKLWEIPSPPGRDISLISFLSNNKLACINESSTYFINAQTGVSMGTGTNPLVHYKSTLSFNKKSVYTSTETGMVKFDIETGRIDAQVEAGNKKGSIPHEFANGFAVGNNGDNSIHIFDILKKRDAGKIYTFSGNTEFVFMNRDNLFEGGDKASRSMYFLKDNRILPLQSLFEKFYTPRITQQVLTRNEPGAPVVPINNIKAPPVTSLAYQEITRNLVVADDVTANVVKTGLVRLSVKASSPNDAISEIRLYHNGKQIIQGARNLEVTDNSEETKKFDIELQPGENTFMAISLNSQRTESVPVKLILTYQVPKQAAGNIPVISNIVLKPVLHLLIVGINQYKNPKYNLNYALADAQGFAEKIKQSCGGLFENCKPYIITDQQATKEQIINTLKKIEGEANPQDVFIFYYAGHGVLNDAKEKEFFLVPHDVTQLYGNDDGLTAKGLSAKELQDHSNILKAQKQLYILDACQSAGALQALALRGAAEEKAIAQLARSTGTHWLTASGSDQFASEFGKLGHGAFTYVLLNGLKGAAALENGSITVNSLKAYIEAKVPEITEQYKGTPQYPASYGFGQDFPLFIVK